MYRKYGYPVDVERRDASFGKGRSPRRTRASVAPPLWQITASPFYAAPHKGATF